MYDEGISPTYSMNTLGMNYHKNLSIYNRIFLTIPNRVTRFGFRKLKNSPPKRKSSINFIDTFCPGIMTHEAPAPLKIQQCRSPILFLSLWNVLTFKCFLNALFAMVSTNERERLLCSVVCCRCCYRDNVFLTRQLFMII